MSSNIPEDIRRRLRELASNRCGYCLSPQHLVMGQLEIEHIIPQAKNGSDDEENLWIACRLCNNYKSDQTQAVDPESGANVPLFNPREEIWADHFTWNEDGTRIIGTSACGRATVVAVRLNNLIAVTVRSYWVAAGWHPPDSRSDNAR